MSAGFIICGGPEPHTRAACYGGCYEWCYMADTCATPEEGLTAKQHHQIRTFQKRSGGCFPNDLREESDFGLTATQRLMVASTTALHSTSPRNRTARALERRGLVSWWPTDLEADWHDPVTFKSVYTEPGHWHLLGEGASVVAKITGSEPSLCSCVGSAS